MISIHDKDFNIVKLNKAFAEFLQDKPEKFIGKKCYKIIHGAKKPHSNCPCQQIRLTKKSVIVEFFEPHLGKHLELSASPIIDEEGEISGSVHIIKDITECVNCSEDIRLYDLLIDTINSIKSIYSELF